MLANEPPVADPPPSCARTDAKPIDRDIQMKYDIAKNEDGPLRRTVKHPDMRGTEGKNQEEASKPPGVLTLEKDGQDLESKRHPGLDERIANIEAHLSVRYGQCLRHHNVVSY